MNAAIGEKRDAAMRRPYYLDPWLAWTILFFVCCPYLVFLVFLPFRIDAALDMRGPNKDLETGFRDVLLISVAIPSLLLIAVGWIRGGPLHHAARSCQNEVLKWVVSSRRVRVDARTLFGRTPLHLAASVGNAAGLETLINARAAVNCRDIWGLTPLHMSVMAGQKECVEVLLQNGADATQVDKRGESSTALARRLKNTNVMQLFTEGIKGVEE